LRSHGFQQAAERSQIFRAYVGGPVDQAVGALQKDVEFMVGVGEEIVLVGFL
jgi:hypothetical protein